ncbi:hypothetical protein FRC12_003306 [Ceratobasidium sp. 428]|nr:hypothetical protein FRC12_003306 [Ceratobasidium sp. 428]
MQMRVNCTYIGGKCCSHKPQSTARNIGVRQKNISSFLEVTKGIGTTSKQDRSKWPLVTLLLKKRESLAQRTLRRTFKKIPRGAQVKVLGAHAAVRMISGMNEEIEAEEEAAVAASVIVVGEDENEPEDVCRTDPWVELNNKPAVPSPVLVKSSQNIPRAGVDEMEWSMIDEDECRAAA